jgi:uncharacterized protein (TIGR02611 family)
MSLAVGQVARWVWFPFRVTIRFILRNGKRIAVSVAGLVLLLLGLAMMVLPGPGILFILAGLAVLATEYVWAQRMLNYAKRKAGQAKDAVLRKKPDEPRTGASGSEDITPSG